MHSSINRLQSVFGFFTTVALVVAGFAALSTLLFPTDATTASVQLKNVQVAHWEKQSRRARDATCALRNNRETNRTPAFSVKGRPHYYSSKREEYAQIRFDLDADLSPLFNWNTKQLFVYVYASYSSSDNKNTQLRDSEALIWDTIIPATPSPYSWDVLKEKVTPLLPASITGASPKKAKRSGKATDKKTRSKKAEAEAQTPGVLRLRGQKAKYQISDITGRLAERENVTLSVGWNVQPWVGALWWSPGTGAVPRTEGTVVRSKAFDFPPLKVKKAENQESS
ncbi:Signal peptidase 22kDa subunit [Penicillium argentinense]|uniref:Signal peptidase subunit 3 n=1 Tax=Penicillium argentinense TaxID=1131581 RepID=A0A9W9KB45_9EURO|nr:Signal peptidase 22kDa subunit [Penicillium argentinense]KAJ5099658.1 Signal peptidase 22kDa subunit [Penicillium argentinense]